MQLFEIVNGYDLVYKWFDVLKSAGHYIIGYVIMPNHLHSVIGFRKSNNINTIIGNGKRMMSYELVRRLKKQGEQKILTQCERGVRSSERKRNKLHAIWEDSFDWKFLDSHHLIEQKLDYIHLNPCKGKWDLAKNPADYLHSSAKFYILNQPGIYPVTSYMEMEDINLDSVSAGQVLDCPLSLFRGIS